jgi:hypothetical protein
VLVQDPAGNDPSFSAVGLDGGPKAGVDVTGTVMEVRRDQRSPCAGADDCAGDVIPIVVVSIRDGAGGTWTIRLFPALAADSWEASARELIGKPVTLKYRYRRAFQYPQSVGFVLTDDQGLVMAAEAGPWVSTLGTDIPLPVRRGETICRMGVCETRPTDEPFSGPGTPLVELVFSGAADVAVGIPTDRELAIGSRSYFAHNSGATTTTQFGCTDWEETDKWAVWRRAAADAGTTP